MYIIKKYIYKYYNWGSPWLEPPMIHSDKLMIEIGVPPVFCWADVFWFAELPNDIRPKSKGDTTVLGIFQDVSLNGCWTKNRGKSTPKMDGENNGKSLLKWHDLEGFPPIFGKYLKIIEVNSFWNPSTQLYDFIIAVKCCKFSPKKSQNVWFYVLHSSLGGSWNQIWVENHY